MGRFGIDTLVKARADRRLIDNLIHTSDHAGVAARDLAMWFAHLLCTDDQAVQMLTGHHAFRAHITPIQLLNKATDPFLPGVRPHLFRVLHTLEALTNLRVTLLFTYSGITDSRVEPIAKSSITTQSIRTAYARTISHFLPANLHAKGTSFALVMIAYFITGLALIRRTRGEGYAGRWPVKSAMIRRCRSVRDLQRLAAPSSSS